jgi:hypothetical protein
MRLLIFMSAFILLSCGQNSPDKKPVNKDTAFNAVVKKDSIAKMRPEFYTTPDEKPVNESLAKKFGSKWHVMNDREARWIKDAFEYFIVPRRKENPDYPYITNGDFDGDGKADTAAVVTDADKKDFRIAILPGLGNIELWKDDVLINAALTTIAKGEAVEGGNNDHPKKIKMKNDGINVEYFEQASFVIYRSGGSFKRLQTGD